MARCYFGLSCLFIVALITMLGVYGRVRGPLEASKKSAARVEAWVECQDHVMRRLKAPATSTFQGIANELIHDLGNDRFLVTAYVDSQNSFGAMLRTHYRCTASQFSDGKWLVEDLKTQP